MVKTFICKLCSIEFKKETRSYAYYCPDCKKKNAVRKTMESKKKRMPETQIGVGSGGNQEGSKNPYWDNGHSIYKKTYENKMRTSKNCELCNSNKFLVIHHKDFNRKNGKPYNLIKLCRKCHAKIHKLYLNLKSCRSKTPSKR